MSVNDSIALYNKETGGHLPPLSVELVLARTLNQLEMYLGQYEATGMKAVEKQYYKYWLHRFVIGCYLATKTLNNKKWNGLR